MTQQQYSPGELKTLQRHLEMWRAIPGTDLAGFSLSGGDVEACEQLEKKGMITTEPSHGTATETFASGAEVEEALSGLDSLHGVKVTVPMKCSLSEELREMLVHGEGSFDYEWQDNWVLTRPTSPEMRTKITTLGAREIVELVRDQVLR